MALLPKTYKNLNKYGYTRRFSDMKIKENLLKFSTLIQ